MIPFKDFKGKPRNQEVNFNLNEPDVFKLLRQFQIVLDWQTSMKGELRELSTQEVTDFYTTFEEIMLSAWGEPSEDGLYFRKAGRYDFEESALFGATMVYFLNNPLEVGKFLDEIMPQGLQDLVKNADVNLAELENAPGNSAELQAEIARLRAQVAASQNKEPTV